MASEWLGLSSLVALWFLGSVALEEEEIELGFAPWLGGMSFSVALEVVSEIL